MLLGNNACQTFLDDSKFSITENINTTRKIVVDNNEIEVWFNYHPSFILRKGGVKDENDTYLIFKERIKKMFEKFYSW